MPQPYTRIEIKLSDDLKQQVDNARGDQPMATWIREAIQQRLLDEEDMNPAWMSLKSVGKLMSGRSYSEVIKEGNKPLDTDRKVEGE